jgi:uncharacterized protein (DUF2336 family)
MERLDQRDTFARFAALAAHSADGTRGDADELYLAVATLFAGHEATFSQREQDLAVDILRRLTHKVEMSIRIALAESLADRADAPHELMLLLANDRIEIAANVIQRSPMLNDADLIHLLRTCSVTHQTAIARRPHIGEAITAALAQNDEESVLTELLHNATAQIAVTAFCMLAEKAHHMPALQEPLIARADLPPLLATRMYHWVSQALREELTRRFPAATQAVREELDDAVAAARSMPPASAEEAAARLTAKLAVAGQLRGSFLMRALHQSQLELFEHGFAALLEMDVETLRRALYGEQAVLLALACRGAGIDRAAFPAVFTLSRQLQGRDQYLSAEARAEGMSVFAMPKAEALARLKALLLS